MDKIIVFAVMSSIAAVPLVAPSGGGQAPALSEQQLLYGTRAGGAVTDLISAKEFGRENAEWLARHYGNSRDMTLLCGCAEGWRRVLAEDEKAGMTPVAGQALRDRFLPSGRDARERVKYVFRDPGFMAGGDGYQVLGGSVPAAAACSAIGGNGVRLAFEMSVPSDREGFRRLDGACQAPGAGEELASSSRSG